MQAAEKLHREKLAAEREGQKEEETADPMVTAMDENGTDIYLTVRSTEQI